MTGQELRSHFDFEQALKPGNVVQMFWTDNGVCHQGAAKVVRVSRLFIAGDLISPNGKYLQGSRVYVPRLTPTFVKWWGTNNAAFPLN